MGSRPLYFIWAGWSIGRMWLLMAVAAMVGGYGAPESRGGWATAVRRIVIAIGFGMASRYSSSDGGGVPPARVDLKERAGESPWPA